MIFKPFEVLLFGKIPVKNMRKILMPLFGDFRRSSRDWCESDYNLHKSRDNQSAEFANESHMDFSLTHVLRYCF